MTKSNDDIDEKFLKTKNRRKFLSGLKQKVDIFIRIKNIFKSSINKLIFEK